MAVLQNAYSSPPERSDQEDFSSEIRSNSAGINDNAGINNSSGTNNSSGIRSGPGDLRDRHWANSMAQVCRCYCIHFPLFKRGFAVMYREKPPTPVGFMTMAVVILSAGGLSGA